MTDLSDLLTRFADFMSEPIARRALLAGVMIGFANGYISGFILLRRSALQISTVSCTLLPGIAVAVLLFGLSQWSVLTGAVVAALLVGLGSLFVARTSRVDEDSSLGVIHTAAFAAGYLILVQMGLQQKIDDWLFGSIMGLSNSDLWISFFISAATVCTLTALRRPLLIHLFEPDIAASLGINGKALNYALFALVILVLVSSLQAVGAILSVGLLITPAATIYLLTDKPQLLFWGSGLLGGVSAFLAFFISFPLNWHISSTIILVLGAFFVLAYLFSPKYGLLFRGKKAKPSAAEPLREEEDPAS